MLCPGGQIVESLRRQMPQDLCPPNWVKCKGWLQPFNKGGIGRTRQVALSLQTEPPSGGF